MGIEPNKVIYSMIGVSKFYDRKPVLKDIYLSYFYGAKIGVIGLNGSGKSSLLRILAGADNEFNGETVLSPGHTVGFLAQEPELDDKKTVREIVEEGVKETVDTLNEYNRINEQFGEPLSDDEMSTLIERIHRHLKTRSTRGTSIRVLRWRWMPSAALPEIPQSLSSREAKGGGWPFADSFCRNLISCSWTNPPTTSMPRR